MSCQKIVDIPNTSSNVKYSSKNKIPKYQARMSVIPNWVSSARIPKL